MWTSKFWPIRYWAERYWAKVGAVSVQTQETVRIRYEAVAWSGLKTEVVDVALLDIEAVTYAALKNEVLV